MSSHHAPTDKTQILDRASYNYGRYPTILSKTVTSVSGTFRAVSTETGHVVGSRDQVSRDRAIT